MTYKIIKVSQIEDTITTTVELHLDTQIMTVDIFHFRPQSNEEIDQNIKDRSISEQAKLDALTELSTVIPTIAIGETVIF